MERVSIIWDMRLLQSGDLGGTELTASHLAASTSLTRIELSHCHVLVFLWDKTFHHRRRPLKICDVLNKSKTFRLAGKFAETGELNNSIALGSSWSWRDSIGLSFPKHIWAVRTSKRHSQTSWAAYNRLRPDELCWQDWDQSNCM